MSKPAFIKRHKILTGFAVLLLLIVVYLISWRTYRIASIPDVGEPFDVEAYLAKFDVEENAYDVFREAMEMRREALGAELYQQYRYQDDNVDAAIDDWSAANEETKEYLELCRPAMAKWRQATEVDFGFEIHPRDFHLGTLLPILSETSLFEDLHHLEVSRLFAENQSEDSWPIIKDMFTLQRHYRTGGIVAYSASSRYYQVASNRFQQMLKSERFSVSQLRDLQTQLMKIHRNYPSVQNVLCMEYFGPMNYHQLTTISALNWMSGETEVLARTRNLLFGNWIAHFDDLPADRPTKFSHNCDRTGTIKFSSIDDEVIDEIINCGFDVYHTDINPQVYLSAFHRLSNSWVALTTGPYRFENLYWQDQLYRKLNLTHLALQIYYREQGHLPEQLDELVPDYLDEVPTAAELDGKALLYEPGANSFELSLGEPYREE